MMRLRRLTPLFALLVAAAADVVHAAPSAVADALMAHRSPFTLDHGELRGDGAGKLVAAARSARFVLVGEDHGFADVPQFTQALYHALAPSGFHHLVLEIGPASADEAAVALQTDPRALARIDAQTPSALSFLSWREDAALAADVARAEGPTALWGVDQEFILSTRRHFAQLAQWAPGADARRLAEDYAHRDTEAYRRMVHRHDPGALLLPQLAERDFDALRQAFAKAAPQARELIEALAQSAEIYRAQGSAPYASNRQRAQWMKQQFARRYRALAAIEPGARVLFRMGAYHMGRGLSPTGQYDLGNLASEWAESDGAHSWHMLVIAAGGTVNQWRPFSTDNASKAARYDAHAELDPLGAGPFVDHALPNSWTLFDLTALRSEAKALEAGGTAFERLVFAYDAVVVIDVAHAAHDIAE